jgi:prepilin-type N-terminal cleavage/methylation domain-containing protein
VNNTSCKIPSETNSWNSPLESAPVPKPLGGRSSHDAANSTTGFTLIELIAAMAIIALLLLVVSGAFTGMGRGASAQKAASDVAAALSQARQYAVAQNVPCLFVVLGPRFQDVNNTPPIPAYIGPVRSAHYYAIFDPSNRTYLTGWTELPKGTVFDATQPSTSGRNILATGNDADMLYCRTPVARMIPFPGDGGGSRQVYTNVTLPGIAFRTDGTVRLRPDTYFQSLRLYVAEGRVTDPSTGTVVLRPNGSKYSVSISPMGHVAVETN